MTAQIQQETKLKRHHPPHTRHDACLVRPVHTTLKGRVRCKVAGLHRSESLKVHLESSLSGHHAILKVQANPLTGNLLLHFSNRLSVAEVVQLVENHLDRVLDMISSCDIPSTALTKSSGKITSLAQHRKRRSGKTQQKMPVQQPPQPWHNLGSDVALTHFQTSPTTGLSTAVAGERYQRFGPNQLTSVKQRSEWNMLLEQFTSLPVGLLGVSAAVSLFTGGVLDAAIIVGVIGINAGIGFFTERQSEKTISALNKLAPRMAQVLRNGTVINTEIESVVTGDILALTPGTYIAADVRLLKTLDLSVDESALTGESMPVAKSAAVLAQGHAALAERSNMAYMGTTVTGGSGLGVVVATAMHTELGRIQSLVGDTRPPETPMQRQLDEMGTQLAILSGAVCAGVFFLGLVRGYSWLEMLKASTSLAVAAVPEGLPAVATTTLALGIKDMARHKVAVRHLDAVETLGSVQVFCMDKTGTLTLNRMSVVSVALAREAIVVSDGQFFSHGRKLMGSPKEELQFLLEATSLCSEVEITGSRTNPSLSGSPTEVAMVEAAGLAGIDLVALRERYPRQDVQHRAENRLYMRTTHTTENGQTVYAIKGSPSEVLTMCSHYRAEGQEHELDDALRDRIQIENEQMAGNALRVLGVAYGEEDESSEQAQRFVWLGLVGMADPLRTGMGDLMAMFHRAGIRTIMITGDQSATAYAIGKQLGLNGDQPLKILDSSSLDKIDPALLAALVKEVHIFARVSPAHKLQIVQALQRSGEIVAMTGDGINDSPALKAANIGVAMGQNGAEVARSVSDIVLEDDNLHTMSVAISEGRSIYSNIRKTIHFLLATNFTEIEVMAAGILFGLGQPLNPMQLLWINLISDIFPGLALSLEPPEQDTMERSPREAQEPIVQRRDLKRMATESAVISTSTLAAFAYGRLRYGPGANANTMAFTTLSFAQLLHALSCRSDTHSIYDRGKLPSNKYLNLAMTGTLGLQFAAAVVPGLRKLLGTTPLGLLDGLIVAAGAGLPLLINEASKTRPTKHLNKPLLGRHSQGAGAEESLSEEPRHAH